MLGQILPNLVALATMPAGILMLLSLLAVIRSEVRYARHDSVKARMRRFAAQERERRGATLSRGVERGVPGACGESATNDRPLHR